MRFIKLSPKMNFNTADDVIEFFEKTLPCENKGRFRFTAGRIRADGLVAGETLVFSHLGRVYYLAHAVTGRRNNDDEFSSELPFYFEVDLDSIHRVDISLHEIELRAAAATGEAKHLAHTQGWPRVKNAEYEEELWQTLVGDDHPHKPDCDER